MKRANNKIQTMIIEMKNMLYGLNGRLDNAEEKISKLEDMTIKTTQNETRGQKEIKNKYNINKLWNKFK